MPYTLIIVNTIWQARLERASTSAPLGGLDSQTQADCPSLSPRFSPSLSQLNSNVSQADLAHTLKQLEVELSRQGHALPDPVSRPNSDCTSVSTPRRGFACESQGAALRPGRGGDTARDCCGTRWQQFELNVDHNRNPNGQARYSSCNRVLKLCQIGTEAPKGPPRYPYSINQNRERRLRLAFYSVFELNETHEQAELRLATVMITALLGQIEDKVTALTGKFLEFDPGFPNLCPNPNPRPSMGIK